MKKRTPQEFADFTGCYMVQSKEGLWYLLNRKPEVEGNNWIGNGEYAIRIDERLISVSANHDWTHLYEPHNKSETNYQNQPEVDNKAPHQSEVHVEKEYVLLCEFQPNALMQKVNELLKDEFKLYGNPWTGPDVENYGYIHYQAMVRG